VGWHIILRVVLVIEYVQEEMKGMGFGELKLLS
jgi:hypothetical protein